MKYERLTKRGMDWHDDVQCDDEKIYNRLAELEDKIECGELVDVKETHIIPISRGSGKSSKRLEVVDVLAKYENGTLVELPCKVGDTVYVLREDCFGEDNYKTKCHIAEGFVKKIYINKTNEIFLQIISWVSGRAWSKDSRNYKISTFGKAVFLTKAEAEAKLRELKEKEV